VNDLCSATEDCNPCLCLQTWINNAKNIFSGATGGSSTGYAYLTAALLASGLGYIVALVPTLKQTQTRSAAAAAALFVCLCRSGSMTPRMFSPVLLVAAQQAMPT
jgi:hypothetical protein